jgi:hypothetical protein
MTLDEFKKIVPPYQSLAKKTKVIGNKSPVHLLYDPVSCRILCFSVWTSTVNMLRETNINSWTRYSLNITSPEMFPAEAVFDKSFLCWWNHNGDVNKWVIKNDDDFTYDELYNYHLTVEKAAAMDELLNRLVHYRRPHMNSVYMQDNIYYMKYTEAMELKKSTDVDPYEYPLVNDYAMIANIDIQQAADDIILQHKIARSSLVNSESLRMRYMRQLKDCQDIQQIKPILNNYYTDGEVYGRL